MERKTYKMVARAPRTIVLFCLDPRFRAAHNLFIEKELGLAKNDFLPIAIAGGAGVLARPRDMQSCFWSVIGQLNLFTSHLRLDNIVLINHEDCRRYDSLKKKGTATSNAEKEDLYRAMQVFSDEYPGIEVSAYYARFTQEDPQRIFFETIQESSLRQPLQLIG